MIWRRFLLAGLIFFNIFLLYNLIWSDNGIFAYLELKNRHAQLQERLDAVSEKSLDLSQEIRWLKPTGLYRKNGPSPDELPQGQRNPLPVPLRR
jgi:cell division protein FtsB